jgi:hypothetical protein
MTRYLFTLSCGLLVLTSIAAAQTTTLSVVIGPEASLTVNTGTTSLTTASSTFGNPFTGTTSLTYEIRTTKVAGTGTVTLKVTADFAGVGGPSVTTPPSAGDALTYTCTVSAPGTGCSGTLTSSTAASTSVGTFGAAANSAKAGNAASVAWALTDDPAYATGTYTATSTFTISST